jgi:single-strand DNA-binding protein
MINKVMLIGNLGRDPEVRKLESGAIVANFSVATSENYKDKNGEWQSVTEWHDISVWAGLAEAAERTLKKGNLVYVEGKIRTRSWKDADGNDKYRTEILAQTFRRLERKEQTSESGESENRYGNESGKQHATASSSASENNDADHNMEDDDLPF